MSSFLSAYMGLVARSLGNDFDDNHDTDRFGPAPRIRRSVRQTVRRTAGRMGWVTTGLVRQTLDQALVLVEPLLRDLEWCYAHLADEESRELVVKLLAFRALGPGKIKLPLNNTEYWQKVAEMKRRAVGCETIDPGFLGFHLAKMNLREIGYPIKLFFFAPAVVIQFIEQPYRCIAHDRTIQAEEGDIVLDCGGCYGDTALYFAHKVGKSGKVATFEFLPANLEILTRNLALNPQLAERIEVISHPLWSEPDRELFVNGHGPAASVGPLAQTSGDQSIRTVSIDQIAKRESLPTVDFIKMDIEGAELPALLGAEQTLRRYRPKLAISVYHRLQDFWEVPRYLDSLGLGYQFFLRHFTIHQEETVLYAAVP